MRYHEAANFLFDLRRFSVSPGTDSVIALLDHLGNPEEDVAFVQVAGSNGKGSTARMTESVLRDAGYSVGLYTSPHLEDLSERIRVDGHPMSDDAIATFIAETKSWLVDRAGEGEPLTFFEVVTAMGIWQFARRDVDVAVLEVGLGGEYDATSAVSPIATAVTNVSLEHTSVLGDTIAEIARTKAKIAESGVPLVTACGGEALDIVREVVDDADGDLVTVTGPGVESPAATPDVTASYEGRVGPSDAGVTLRGADWTLEARIPMVGDHQATNAGVAVALARKTAASLGDELSDHSLIDGLARATWPGRFEVVGTEPFVVLDGAHNPAACATLAETLGEYEYDDLHLVFAAMHDKDHVGTVASLPTPDSVRTCRPDMERAEDPEVLAAAFKSAGVTNVESAGASNVESAGASNVESAGASNVESAASVADAFADARARAGPNDCVLLTGSLFAVAEARATYTRIPRPVRVNDERAGAELLRDADVPESIVSSHAGGLPHEVVRLTLSPRQAARIESELRKLGGECAVSGVTGGGERVDVVLAGTTTQYRELATALSDAPHGVAGVTDEVLARVGGGDDPTGTPNMPNTAYPWGDGTAVMGVLNVTPDSFHDGGVHEALGDAVAGVREMVAAGADLVDVGGESTRPGAEEIPADAEIDRVIPVIEAIQEVPAIERGEVLVSVDTRKPAVAEAALEAGADVINDVTGLTDPRMREVVADANCPVIVMHSVEAPVDPTTEVEYEDVVADVIDALQERVLLAEAAGIDRDQVIIDPGLGFGKSAAESFELLGRLDEFAALGCPVLVGHSYKSMFAGIERETDAEREHPTVAATALATERGADIVRVHDVEENRAAVDAVEAANDPDSVE